MMDVEARRRYDREYKRALRARMTPEQKEIERAKQRERDRRRYHNNPEVRKRKIEAVQIRRAQEKASLQTYTPSGFDITEPDDEEEA